MNKNKTLFISDVHLGIFSPGRERERERKLAAFLKNSLHAGDRLIILGDLFDFWFEYRTVIPKQFFLIISCLLELTESGVRVDYFAGNHDFWAGDFFKKELGLEFHAESLREIIDGKTFYLIHGDGLKKADRGYRLLKRIFRNRLNIALYRWLHPDVGVPLAKQCSGLSRNYTAKRDYGGNEEYTAFAEKLFTEGVDYIIMGHTHSPFEYKSGDKIMLNIGDWITNYTYAVYENGSLFLNNEP